MQNLEQENRQEIDNESESVKVELAATKLKEAGEIDNSYLGNIDIKGSPNQEGDEKNKKGDIWRLTKEDVYENDIDPKERHKNWIQKRTPQLENLIKDYKKRQAILNILGLGDDVGTPKSHIDNAVSNVGYVKEYMDNFFMKGSGALGKFGGLSQDISYLPDENMKVKGDVRAHELSHAKNPPVLGFLAKLEKPFIKKVLRNRHRAIPQELKETRKDKKYTKTPHEIAAFVDQARYILNLDPEKTYTEGEYNEMLKDPRLPKRLKMWNGKEFKKLNEGLVQGGEKIILPENSNQNNEGIKQNIT